MKISKTYCVCSSGLYRVVGANVIHNRRASTTCQRRARLRGAKTQGLTWEVEVRTSSSGLSEQASWAPWYAQRYQRSDGIEWRDTFHLLK